MSEAVKSAQRALAVLELLTMLEEPATFTGIADRLGYPRSSLHGLLRTLVSTGWADLDDGRYTLGIRTFEAGNAYARSRSLVDRARPLMTRIATTLDETVQLAVLDGVQNVYVAKIDGGQALTLASEVGRRLPAHATGVGKVLLADLPRAELDRRLTGVRLARLTRNTITRRAELHAALDAIRQRGFGMDDEEYTPGVRCVAVPIRDHGGRTAAAMSVSVPAVRFDQRLRERAHVLLAEVAGQLSAALGYRQGGSPS